MLSRRMLVGGVAVAAMSGCSYLPAPKEPAQAPTPDPSVPGHAALHHVRTALDNAAAGPLSSSQASLVAWALDVTADQFAATSLAAPTTAPSTPQPVSQASDLTALTAALTTAGEAFLAQALDETTARPLVWASMAAWCVATAAQLPDGTAAREPARGVRLPAPQDRDAAALSALEAVDATVFGLQVAAGAPGWSGEESTAVHARLTFWSALRDDLTILARAASVMPSPAPPWYDVKPPTDVPAARALVARLQAAALPVLGRTLAHGPASLRPVLARALANGATDVPSWGGLLERWPGLPTT